MALLDDFRRVTRREPCPVCGRPDWCLRSRAGYVGDPEAVICARVTSEHRWGDAGWLHRFRGSPDSRAPRTVSLSAPARDLRVLASRYVDAATDPRVESLARSLEVTQESLRRLMVGWTGRAWSFPMFDDDRRIVGIRLRYPCGRKLSVRGGREGLFLPEGPDHRYVFVAEGPTDTAALLSLGIPAIGRPSATGGTRLATRFLRTARVESVVVLADADEPGQRGAAALASTLRVCATRVRVLTPPSGVKDARDWVRAGVTRQDVLREARQVPPMGLALRPGAGQ